MIDGDTIRVWVDGELRTVRLIGVDTPETKHPTKKVQRGGQEASAFTQAALDRQTVRLEADPAGDLVDRFDRLLRYVYLDGQDFSALLIGLGYGRAVRAFPYSKRRAYLALEAEARMRRHASLRELVSRALYDSAPPVGTWPSCDPALVGLFAVRNLPQDTTPELAAGHYQVNRNSHSFSTRNQF